MYIIKFKDGSVKKFETLVRANLSRANLCEANLCGADLAGANLREADLSRASLYEADFYGADLREANLRGADLRGADLRGADLRAADLREANLCEANLCGADLAGADLKDTEIIMFCFGKHFGFIHTGSQYEDGSYCKIGCKDNSLSWWLENGERIWKENDYSERDIRLYKMMLTGFYKELSNIKREK